MARNITISNQKWLFPDSPKKVILLKMIHTQIPHKGVPPTEGSTQIERLIDELDYEWLMIDSKHAGNPSSQASN
jgi:hypothetical protein